jgi:Uma2 family endonuclease
LSPFVSKHNVVAQNIYDLLFPYKSSGQGTIFWEIPYILEERSNWVKGSRVPDFMYFVSSRMNLYKENHPDWQDSPIILIPDLVIEIISPSDRYSDVTNKIRKYIADGVQLIWIVDPLEKVVSVYKEDLKNRTDLDMKDWLIGEDILVDFKIQISQLFKDVN